MSQDHIKDWSNEFQALLLEDPVKAFKKVLSANRRTTDLDFLFQVWAGALEVARAVEKLDKVLALQAAMITVHEPHYTHEEPIVALQTQAMKFVLELAEPDILVAYDNPFEPLFTIAAHARHIDVTEAALEKIFELDDVWGDICPKDAVHSIQTGFMNLKASLQRPEIYHNAAMRILKHADAVALLDPVYALESIVTAYSYDKDNADVESEAIAKWKSQFQNLLTQDPEAAGQYIACARLEGSYKNMADVIAENFDRLLESKTPAGMQLRSRFGYPAL